MLYLRNKPYGRSPTDIQLHCTDTKQDYNEVYELLCELCLRGQLRRERIGDVREIFIITDDGKDC
jgi:hypothetical protein